MDRYVRVWDLRYPGKGATASLFGHVSSTVAKQSVINHPEFYGDGR